MRVRIVIEPDIIQYDSDEDCHIGTIAATAGSDKRPLWLDAARYLRTRDSQCISAASGLVRRQSGATLSFLRSPDNGGSTPQLLSGKER
jgi:hypothetical protein